MGVDFHEVFGAELMTPDAKERVQDLISTLPLTTGDKASLYFQWARQVGLNPTYAEAQRVANLRKKFRPI